MKWVNTLQLEYCSANNLRILPKHYKLEHNTSTVSLYWVNSHQRYKACTKEKICGSDCAIPASTAAMHLHPQSKRNLRWRTTTLRTLSYKKKENIFCVHKSWLLSLHNQKEGNDSFWMGTLLHSQEFSITSKAENSTTLFFFCKYNTEYGMHKMYETTKIVYLRISACKSSS